MLKYFFLSKFFEIFQCLDYRYENPKRAKIMDFDQVLAMTKGHIALGGGGLALFGSGCLYCWPENLSVRSSLKLYIQCDQIFMHKNEHKFRNPW